MSEPTTDEMVAFIREHYGTTMAERMAQLFLEREPADDVERGFQASVRRSITREMQEAAS